MLQLPPDTGFVEFHLPSPTLKLGFETEGSNLADHLFCLFILSSPLLNLANWLMQGVCYMMQRFSQYAPILAIRAGLVAPQRLISNESVLLTF